MIIRRLISHTRASVRSPNRLRQYCSIAFLLSPALRKSRPLNRSASPNFQNARGFPIAPDAACINTKKRQRENPLAFLRCYVVYSLAKLRVDLGLSYVIDIVTDGLNGHERNDLIQFSLRDAFGFEGLEVGAI